MKDAQIVLDVARLAVSILLVGVPMLVALIKQTTAKIKAKDWNGLVDLLNQVLASIQKCSSLSKDELAEAVIQEASRQNAKLLNSFDPVEVKNRVDKLIDLTVSADVEWNNVEARVRALIAEAEMKKAYTGQEKKDFVLTRLLMADREAFDKWGYDRLSNIVDVLVNFTKEVNAK